MSFLEKSIGTNSISISMDLKKVVYTLPLHHYCTILCNTYLYSKPLLHHDRVIAYLVLANENKPIKKEMLAVTELIGYCTTNKYLNMSMKQNDKGIRAFNKEQVELSEKQLSVLRLLAGGKTDKAIAIEMDVCFDTIKYHKKNIFCKLNANCTIEAVIKALKLNIITLDQINI